MTQAFVLDNCCMADTLVLTENAVGERDAFRSQLQRSVREVIQLDVFAGEFFAYSIPLQDDLLAIVGQRKLRADVALLAMADNIVSRDVVRCALRCRSSGFAGTRRSVR